MPSSTKDPGKSIWQFKRWQILVFPVSMLLGLGLYAELFILFVILLVGCKMVKKKSLFGSNLYFLKKMLHCSQSHLLDLTT